MKYLGIDYGSKRIGLAISDESGTFAFPKAIISSGEKAFREILDIISENGITDIVIGNSLDQSGVRNAIMEDVDAFAEALQNLTGIPCKYMDERFSSSAAKAFHFRKPIANKRGNTEYKTPIDDQAAAIMLQRYLDKNQ